VLAALGCNDDLPRASEIAHMRVLGAKTEVIGDPTRSSPKPGEVARLTWDMAYPDLKQDDSQLRSIFGTCTAPERFTGLPVCQELLDAARSGSNLQLLSAFGGRTLDCAKTPNQDLIAGPIALHCVQGTPSFDVKVESGFSAAAKLLQGVICRQGIPALSMDDPTGVKCTPLPGVEPDEIESIPVYGTVQVEYSEQDENHNPSIDAAHFRFGEGELPWDALDPEDSEKLSDDCGDAARTQLILSTNGKSEQLVIEYDAGAREPFDGKPEILEFSTYTTWGELSRRFTVFEPDAKLPLRSELKWDLTQKLRDELGERSRLVRFYFTLLDRRGGYAITSRELCVGRDLTRTN
jgi:hypothetical protein